MSRARRHQESCPSCGSGVEIEVYESLSAHREPSLRTAVLDNTLQRIQCECGQRIRIEPKLVYVDSDLKLWVAVHPSDAISNWGPVEAQMRESFEAGYGSAAPAIAQELGAELRPRLVFGWDALREKLLLAQSDLEDVTFELLKLRATKEFLAQESDHGFLQTSQLRLTDLDEAAFELAWVDSRSGDLGHRVQAKRELYDAIDGDKDWAPFREKITRGLFVDINSLMYD